MLGVALLGVLLVLPARAQQHWADCVPSSSTPIVSTGDVSYENGMASVNLKTRYHENQGPTPDVTVRVRVTFDGHTSSVHTVTVPATSGQRVGTAQLGVPAAGHQVVGFKILDDSSYTWCKRTAGVTVPHQTPIHIPPPQTTLPTPDPTPPDYVAEIIADAPPRPTPHPDAPPPPEADDEPDSLAHQQYLYGPHGVLSDETRLAWQCWATFGNPVALAALGVTESC